MSGSRLTAIARIGEGRAEELVRSGALPLVWGEAPKPIRLRRVTGGWRVRGMCPDCQDGGCVLFVVERLSRIF